MNRRRAQLLLLAIMVPIILSAGYTIYSIWNGYRPSLELILIPMGAVFVQAFAAALLARKRNRKKTLSAKSEALNLSAIYVCKT